MRTASLSKPVSVALVALMSLGVLAAGAPSAYACSCMMPEAPAESLAKTDAVFVGTVSDVAFGTGDFARNAVTFDVDRAWKGIVSKTATLSTARDSAACGVNFEAGKAYVVYAHESEDGGLTASLCSRTHAVEGSIEADEDVKALGAATVALADVAPHQSAMASTAVTLVVGLVAVAAGIAAARFLRKPAGPSEPSQSAQ